MSSISKRIFTGFDGYLDIVQKIVASGNQTERCFFETIAEYAEALGRRAGKNGDFELITQSRRVGGNAPILALAAARLGAEVDCVACMGDTQTKPPFDALERAGVHTVSLCAPSPSYVFEFRDGKLMYGENNLPSPDFSLLEQRVGERALQEMLEHAGVVALADYANLPYAASLWGGVLRVLRQACGRERPEIFLDLADISHLLPPQRQEMTELIRQFAQDFSVHLGLNRNEAEQLCGGLSLRASTPREAAEKLHAALGAALVLHTQKSAVYCAADGVFEVETETVARPAATVGAGDHFNAGYCVALLLGLEPQRRLRMACAEATRFVSTGKDPVLEEVLPDREL